MFRYGFSSSAPLVGERDFLETCEELRKETIEGGEIRSPFGYRKVLYTDFTASGRSVQCIETFIQNQVLPYYANTHTLVSATSKQTTFYRAEARQIIKNYLNCDPIEDALIFAGAGATGCVSKFVKILEEGKLKEVVEGKGKGLDSSRTHFKEDRWGSCECTLCDLRLKNEVEFRAHIQTPIHLERVGKEKRGEVRKKVVFYIDPISHHSFSLPFRELAKNYECVECIEFRSVSTFEQDLLGAIQEEDALHFALLCAGSNITGYRRDVKRLANLLHGKKVVVCVDFAAVAGHGKIDMNPKDLVDSHIDVAFFSPHKFLGGPGTSGVLCIKKKLLTNLVPSTPGGGTVFYVSDTMHSFIQNFEEREEAGTPNILADIRAGLTFFLHQPIIHKIAEKEEQMLQRFLQLIRVENVEILQEGQLPIVSFLIRHKDLYLHYNFVACLLNDLFGIQSRGGCACAGPYAQKLLGITPDVSEKIASALEKFGTELVRPGFVRIGLHFTMTAVEVEFLANAVVWIAKKGFTLLPYYTFDVETGEWEHKEEDFDAKRLWLSNLFQKNPIAALERKLVKKIDEAYVKQVFLTADSILPPKRFVYPVLDPRIAPFTWFLLPQDVTGEGRIYFTPVERPNRSLFFIPNAPLPLQKEVETVEAPVEEKMGYSRSQIAPEVPKPIRRKVGEALANFAMIQDGDRVLVGVSGGKDSLSLLHFLKDFQTRCRFKFEVAAATVNPLTPEYDPSPLIPYFQAIGVTYHMLEKPIIEMAKVKINPKKPSICSFCSRLKRGMLQEVMRKYNYNVLALGQHLDDIAESFMMYHDLFSCILRAVKPLLSIKHADALLDPFSVEKSISPKVLNGRKKMGVVERESKRIEEDDHPEWLTVTKSFWQNGEERRENTCVLPTLLKPLGAEGEDLEAEMVLTPCGIAKEGCETGICQKI